MSDAAAHASYLAEHYAKLDDQSSDFRNANLNRLIVSLVRGRDVLDVGCGSGGLLRLLRTDGHAVTGIEPNADIIAIANRIDPDLDIHRGDGSLLDGWARQHDCITMVDVLEHIEDDRRQLELLNAALTPTGRLIVIVPAHRWLYGKRDANQGHFRRYTRRELTSKLTAAGFKIVSTRSWNVLGVLPYWISERLLRRELNTSLRSNTSKGWLGRMLQRSLDRWFRRIENRFGFGIGLSLICVAEKTASDAALERRAA